MKIALFSGLDIRTTSGSRYIVELSNALKAEDVTIFTSRQPQFALMNEDAAKKLTKRQVIYYNTFRWPVTKENFITSLSVFCKLKKYNTIYMADSSIFTSVGMLFLTKIYHNKLILGNHDPALFRKQPIKQTAGRRLFIKLYNPIKFSVIKAIPNIHLLNDSDANTLKKMGYKGRIYRINNFVYNSVPNSEIKNNQKEFIVLFIGRLAIAQKGIDMLDKIVRKVLQENKNVKFHIPINNADGKEIVKRLANDFPKNVVLLDFTKFVPNERFNQFFKPASLFIMTSRTEGMPAALIEALGFGLPAVAFDVSGVNDVLKDEKESVLVAPFDLESFSTAILDYYKAWKKSDYITKKRKVADYIRRAYCKEVIIPKLEKMLTE